MTRLIGCCTMTLGCVSAEVESGTTSSLQVITTQTDRKTLHCRHSGDSR